MTVTDHLAGQIRLSRWFSYPIVVGGIIAWVTGWHFKAVCGQACSWTHGGMVFVVCVALIWIVHGVLRMRFKCPY